MEHELEVVHGYEWRVMPDDVTLWITPEMLQTRQGDEHG